VTLPSTLNMGRSFTNDVIVVDGMWGSGKSLLSSLVGSFSQVEKKRIDHIFEYMLTGASLGHVTPMFAETIIRIYADLDQYNNLVGREVNLRINDDSGFRNTPGSLRYLFRLFGGEGDQIVDRINQRNLGLLLLTHHLTGITQPMVKALGPRLFFIEVIRHPLQLFNYWVKYLDKFDRSREFTLSIESEAGKTPWFAISWLDEYTRMNTADRAIRAICDFHRVSVDEEKRVLAGQEPQLDYKRIVVTFEHILTQTDKVLEQLSKFLGRETTDLTSRAMIRQKVPRALTAKGRAVNQLNWLPNPNLSYKEQLDEILATIKNVASTESLNSIMNCSAEYEKRLDVLGARLAQ
jgi:hypothetical protein